MLIGLLLYLQKINKKLLMQT